MSERKPRHLEQELQKKDAFSCPQEKTYLEILRTADALQLAHQHLFRRHGLSSSLYNALRIVVGAGEEGIPVRAIGSRMVVRQPDASRLVDRLERDRHVRRQRSDDDRRRVLVRATPQGVACLDALRAPLRELQARLLSGLAAEELATLDGLLQRARESAPGH
jgi:DNA-binding MarR family transcriptional regulator